jgi:hypothetical protein
MISYSYKTLARPVLSYGREACTIRRTDERRLISAEMRFLRRTAGYTHWEHKKRRHFNRITNLIDNKINISV